jgi:hypothetical protein
MLGDSLRMRIREATQHLPGEGGVYILIRPCAYRGLLRVSGMKVSM